MLGILNNSIPVLLQILLISFKRSAFKVGIAIIILLIRYLLTKDGISSIVPCTFTPPAIVNFRFEDHHQLQVRVQVLCLGFLTFV